VSWLATPTVVAAIGRPRRARWRGSERAARKLARVQTRLALRDKVQRYLGQRYSPERVGGWLRVEFRGDPEMRVSAEMIDRSLSV
jgi:IS30 family transposase